jgi:hypothetical protein
LPESDADETGGLYASFAARLALLQAPVFRTQDLVELLYQSQELLPVLFHRDKRAELLDPVTFCLVHLDPAVLQPCLYSVCSMSNAAKNSWGVDEVMLADGRVSC